MKIKLAILDPDKRNLNKIVAAFSNKYADKLEIYSFTDPDVALEGIKKYRIRVFLANESYEINTAGMDRCGFAYFTESRTKQNLRGERTICMFMKTEEIYQAIVDLYTSVGGEWGGRIEGDTSSRVLAFCSAGGGAGASSMAAACAIRAAARHKKTLYLNLEKLGKTELFFQAEGQYDMSDVIYVVKGKKSSLHLKLVSHVRHDESGVYFYATPESALHMMELTGEETLRLLTELKNTDYEYVILDMDFGLDDGTIQIFREADVVVMVSDGTDNANAKTERAYRAMEAIEQRREIALVDRLCLAYNRGNSRTAKTLELPDLRVLGKYPVIADATAKQVIQTLSQAEMFDQIL